MKKILSIIAVAILMVSTLTMTASAHGKHGNGNHNSQPQNVSCNVTGCDKTGYHQHNNGHWDSRHSEFTNYTSVCPVDDCTKLGLHEHDGKYYYCKSHSIGLGCGKGHNR